MFSETARRKKKKCMSLSGNPKYKSKFSLGKNYFNF